MTYSKVIIRRACVQRIGHNNQGSESYYWLMPIFSANFAITKLGAHIAANTVLVLGRHNQNIKDFGKI
jgi:hypothetical protein